MNTKRQCKDCISFKNNKCIHICETDDTLECNLQYRPWYIRKWYKIWRPN